MQPESFAPGPLTRRAYRDALGSFATGVTVVTCRDQGRPLAMTANSFTSISLDPPLILWSPAIASSRHDPFVAARDFAVHVLAEDQGALALRCARDGRDFDGIDWSEGPGGTPLIAGAVARFTCTHHASHGAGDHTIVLGQVTEVLHTGRPPLVFLRGGYGAFQPAG